VAIKKLFTIADDQKYFVAREIAMLQGVIHPNIVQFLGVCDHSSGIYLITEYVEHGDLFDLLIFGEKKPSWKIRAKIAFQIATACYYLHSKNIIHRDLKSQNVLIGADFKVKICDLGFATITQNKKRMSIVGTNEWMAPEIWSSDTYDQQVDIFSFGIVLTEMITCRPPSKRSVDKQMAFDFEQFKAEIPENCPPEFLNLVYDCTLQDPAARPSSKDLVTRFRSLESSLTD